MRVLYLATAGTADATRASLPLHIAANGSIEAGQQAAVVLAGDATELVVQATADGVEGVGVPSARDLFAKLVGTRSPSTSDARARPPVGRPTRISVAPRVLDDAAGARKDDRGVRPGGLHLTR